MPYANPEKRKEFMKAYYEKNRGKILSSVQKNYVKSRQKKIEYAKLYYEKNKEVNRERVAIYGKKWSAENAGLKNSYTASRRSKIKQSIDETASMAEIKKFYILAENLTASSGEKHVVDHIKPIRLGGKHHQDNLQVITATDNARKGYKYPYKVERAFNPSMDSQVAVA